MNHFGLFSVKQMGVSLVLYLYLWWLYILLIIHFVFLCMYRYSWWLCGVINSYNLISINAGFYNILFLSSFDLLKFTVHVFLWPCFLYQYLWLIIFFFYFSSFSSSFALLRCFFWLQSNGKPVLSFIHYCWIGGWAI